MTVCVCVGGVYWGRELVLVGWWQVYVCVCVADICQFLELLQSYKICLLFPFKFVVYYKDDYVCFTEIKTGLIFLYTRK